MDSSRAVAYLNLGDAHWAVGDKDKAVKAYGTYLELAPKGADLTQYCSDSAHSRVNPRCAWPTRRSDLRWQES
jgi:hypothetical protein